MGKTWVLHTETKGTGATMVPLERVTKRSSASEPLVVAPKPEPRPPEAPEPSAPRRFRIVDVMTRQALVDGVGTREAIDALQGIRSLVDVNVYVWQDERDRWRLLTFAEQRTIWDLRGPASESGRDAGEAAVDKLHDHRSFTDRRSAALDRA